MLAEQSNLSEALASLSEAHQEMTPEEIAAHALMMAAVIVRLDEHIAKLGRQNKAVAHMAATTHSALTSFTSRLGMIASLMNAGRKREARSQLVSLLSAKYPEFPNLAEMEASVPRLADLLPDCVSPKGSKK